MLTRCPACHAWFRVRAEHLSAAAGRVTCGQCDSVFNALESLTEEADLPPPRLQPAAVLAAPSVASPVDEVAGDRLADETTNAAPPGTPDIAAPPVASVPASVVATDASGAHESVIEDADSAAAITDADATMPLPVTANDAAMTTTDEVPPVLAEELDALAGVRRPLTVTGKLARVAVVLLFIMLAAQVAFVWRGPLVAAVPAAAPFVDRLCQHFNCVTARTAVAGIHLLARDVREHPQYVGVLLVNATMVNNGPQVEPYPELELKLRDGGGQLVGARRFGAHEYLDDSIAIDAGMAVDQPVYVVMEIGADAAAAASFEINFR